MTQQEEIVKGTKTVIKDLDKLKNANILGDDKKKKSLDIIEMGLGAARNMVALASHLQMIEAEKHTLRMQARQLHQDNTWLRDELETTQQKLKMSEETAAQIEAAKKAVLAKCFQQFNQDRNDEDDDNLIN